MPKCRWCNFLNPSDADRCTNCGAAIEASSPKPGEAGRERPAPGQQNVPADLEKELLVLLKQGKKIQAIKLLKDETGTGLKESKDAVEAIAAKHGIPKGSGCAVVILFVLLVSGALASFVWQ